MTFRKERNDRFAGRRVRTLKELWVRRGLANGLCLTPSDDGSSNRPRISSLSVCFCRALNRFPLASSPFHSGSRYFKAVPRAPSRGSSIAESAPQPRGRRFAFVSPIVRGWWRARFPFQMSSSSRPFRRSSRFPFTVVARRSSSLILLLLYLAACCCRCCCSFVSSWTATPVPKLRGAMRPSVSVTRLKRSLRDEEQCVSVLSRALSLIDNRYLESRRRFTVKRQFRSLLISLKRRRQRGEKNRIHEFVSAKIHRLFPLPRSF